MAKQTFSELINRIWDLKQELHDLEFPNYHSRPDIEAQLKQHNEELDHCVSLLEVFNSRPDPINEVMLNGGHAV